MAKYTITLEYQGKQYSFLDGFNYEGWDEYRNADYQVTYMYTEGNYGCDCNKSAFLYQYCDVDFEGDLRAELDDGHENEVWTLKCGEIIKLISIKEGERSLPLEDGDVKQPVFQQVSSGLWIPS